MIFAVIGDIQGNIHALDAVVKAIDAEGIDTILHTGNICVGMAEVNAVVERMQSREIIAVQGDMDRHLARLRPNSNLRSTRLSIDDQEAITRAREFIIANNLEYIRALPRQRRLTLEGIEVLLCYGSPSSPFLPLTNHTPLIRFERERETANAQIILSGGAKLPFYKWVNQTLFVGIAPMFEEHFSPDADYVLVDTETHPWSVRLKRARTEVPL